MTCSKNRRRFPYLSVKFIWIWIQSIFWRKKKGTGCIISYTKQEVYSFPDYFDYFSVVFMLLQKLMPKSRNMTKGKTTWKQFHENITERKRQTDAVFLDVFRKHFDPFCCIKPKKLEIWMCVKWKMEERKRLNTPPQAVCWLYDTDKHFACNTSDTFGRSCMDSPKRRKQTQKTPEQKAFAINHFSVSSVL